MIPLLGKTAAQKVYVQLQSTIASLKQQSIQPCLDVILVGNDPASAVYVKNKALACSKLNITSHIHQLPQEATKNEILTLIRNLNNDPKVHGILCQLPLPNKANEVEVIQTIAWKKDVDCFHPSNLGKLLSETPIFMPCTPFGIIQILRQNKIDLAGKNVVVLGRGHTVGRPLSCILSGKGYDSTVTVCHSRTKNIKTITSTADILISAIGRPESIGEDYIKEDAVVIDVGINRIADSVKKGGYRLVGDIKQKEVESKVAAMTPVPGGVGPMTIAILMYNTINAALLQNNMPLIKLV